MRYSNEAKKKALEEIREGLSDEQVAIDLCRIFNIEISFKTITKWRAEAKIPPIETEVNVNSIKTQIFFWGYKKEEIVEALKYGKNLLDVAKRTIQNPEFAKKKGEQAMLKADQHIQILQKMFNDILEKDLK